MLNFSNFHIAYLNEVDQNLFGPFSKGSRPLQIARRPSGNAPKLLYKTVESKRGALPGNL